MTNQQTVGMVLLIISIISAMVAVRSIVNLRHYDDDVSSSERWSSYTQIALAIIVIIAAIHNGCSR